MATKADFTPEEWQVIQWAVVDTMTYVSLADPGIWDSFKEAGAAARVISTAKSSAANLLVRDIAGDIRTKRDKEATSNPAEFGTEAAERIAQAVALITEKDLGDAAAFKAFVIELAQATAEAVKDVGPAELDAIAKVKAALG